MKIRVHSKIVGNISNALGIRTGKKLIVFESDDWGSIRMPSTSTFQKLEKIGIDLRSADAERYNLYDTLETREDLTCLFEVLESFKDRNGNNVVFTPITIVANPDFQRIKESKYTNYYYESIIDTYMSKEGCKGTYDLWREGIEKRLFIPQIHGREHLNIKMWMNSLKNDDCHTRLAFNEGVTGFVPPQYPNLDFQAAFLLEDQADIHGHEGIIKDGLFLFERIFGYRAAYFVPPNGPINNRLNKVLFENGVKLRTASKIQREPLGNGRYRYVFHWLGQKDKYGIKYITRNCFFEPSQQGKDWVDSCLGEIKTAFSWGKPAIISSHRVNYIGSLYEHNRSKGLLQLTILLRKIIQNWPDVEFITTSQLADIL